MRNKDDKLKENKLVTAKKVDKVVRIVQKISILCT